MPAHRLPLALLLAVAALATASIGYALGHSSATEPVAREALAGSHHPRGAKDRTLALSRVTIEPGGTIDLHHHLGTQVAYIDRGKLTYSVQQGGVKIREGQFEGDSEVVGKIE